MSQNCECTTDLTMLPVKGLVLAVDASSLPGGSGCECGPGSGETLDYSLEEQFTGKHWIDGKKIYQKTVKMGVLPNNTIKVVDSTIINIGHVIKLEGIQSCPYNGTRAWVPMECVGEPNMSTWMRGSDIYVHSYGDRSNFEINYVTIQYTCTDR